VKKTQYFYKYSELNKGKGLNWQSIG